MMIVLLRHGQLRLSIFPPIQARRDSRAAHGLTQREVAPQLGKPQSLNKRRDSGLDISEFIEVAHLILD